MYSYSGRTISGEVKNCADICNCEFIECVFEDCQFTDCAFINCTFSECVFVRCSITNPRVENTGMMFSSFTDCTLVGIRWSGFSGGALAFPVQKFEKCFLKYNDFEKMNFKQFDFMRSSVVDSAFSGCNLGESSFNGCDLKNTEFHGCNLKKSDFRAATGYNLQLTENSVKGARFSAKEAVRLLAAFEIKLEDF